ncbi:MAG: hypothetical protein QM775_19820 [Pirellulales bacterium]
MSIRKFDWFSWLSATKRNHRQCPHKIRDGAAFAEILALLYQGGYEYRELQLNVADCDKSCLIKGNVDLLVMVTRPPLDEGGRKLIQRSKSNLETKIIEAIRPFFEICSRDQVMLDTCTKRLLNDEFRDHALITFYKYGDWSWYRQLLGMSKDLDDQTKPRTAAYLAFVPEGAAGLPPLLVIFGMGGNDTLLWARLLRERYSKRVLEIVRSGKAHFLMAELSPRLNINSVEPVSRYNALGDISQPWEVTVIADGIPSQMQCASATSTD